MAIPRKRRRPAVKWDAHLIQRDAALKGWMMQQLAAEAGIGVGTLHRFYQGRVQTPKTMAKLAAALGHPIKRYALEG